MSFKNIIFEYKRYIRGIVSEHSIHGCDKYYALIVHRKEASHDVLNINGYEACWRALAAYPSESHAV